MKHMRIEIENTVLLFLSINKKFSTRYNYNIILPIYMGDHVSLNKSVCYDVGEPMMGIILDDDIYGIINGQSSSQIKLESMPDISAHFLYYNEDEILGLALSENIINNKRYCNINIRYNDDILTSITIKQHSKQYMFKILKEDFF